MNHFHFRLVRPDKDPTLVAKLFAKLNEYERRCRSAERRFREHGRSPHELIVYNSHTRFKIELLERLLQTGRVDFDEVRHTLTRAHQYDPTYDDASYNLACFVIYDYVEHGGVHLEHGCLPDVA